MSHIPFHAIMGDDGSSFIGLAVELAGTLVGWYAFVSCKHNQNGLRVKYPIKIFDI